MGVVYFQLHHHQKPTQFTVKNHDKSGYNVTRLDIFIQKFMTHLNRDIICNQADNKT